MKNKLEESAKTYERTFMTKTIEKIQNELTSEMRNFLISEVGSGALKAICDDKRKAKKIMKERNRKGEQLHPS